MKYLGAIALWLYAGCALADAHAFDAAAIKTACEDLVLDYAYYRDRPDAQGVAAVFAEDARLEVLGQTFVGRDKIKARIEAGIGGPVFRHMMSTIRIFPVDQDHATGVSYVTVYSAPPGDGPLPVGNVAGVGEYHDRFVRTADGWKIAERKFVMVFAPAAD